MPIYLFRCKVCKKEYEFGTRNALVDCCGEQITRVYSLAGIKFKGTGFYSTDKKWKK